MLLDRVEATVGGASAVVHAWGSGGSARRYDSGRDLAGAALARAVGAMHLVRALVARNSAIRLWLVTRGGQQVTGTEEAVDAAQAVVHGLARTITLEHPELRCTCIDLDPGAAAGGVVAALAEFAEPGEESHVAFREGRRFASRLVRSPTIDAQVDAAGTAGWRLTPVQAGSLDLFQRVPLQRRSPSPGEVEVEVHAVGLNFKDVLNVLGMYPGDPGPLGGECAGVVSSVGANVTHVKPGDEVVAVGSGCFASHLTTRSELVLARPQGQSATEAAAMPIAFLTAAFCLEHLADLRAGERVLIHAAAGGVGMAAVRLALAAKAEVFATAGSPWKRELLESMGVRHVFDSRGTDFARQVLDLTDGAGVDVVLNSLAGPQLDASFQAIAPGGRFIEIGKRDIKSHEWVARLDRSIRYSIVDWGETASKDAALIGRLFAGLVRRVASGELASLPRHEFSIEQAGRAFRFMSQARHAGKIVVTLRPQQGMAIQRNGTYLVTGGLAGIGTVVARWLARRGAGRLVLASRRGVTPEVESLLQELREGGTEVVAVAVDVGREEELASLLRRIRSEGPPLRGIVHGAGVLDDASLVQQDIGRFERVFAPKVRGASLLSAMTRIDPLDWCVHFSSIAAILGSPGQANHSAANAFLDAMSRDARLHGRAFSSINWGPWAELGAAVDRGVASRIGQRGVQAISSTQGLQAMERVVVEGREQAVVLPIDWDRFRAQYAGRPLPPYFSQLATTPPASEPAPVAASSRAPDLARQVAATPESRRRPLLATFLRERALKVLGLDAGRALDPRTPLGDLGLDSLLAVELRNVIGTALGRTLPATLLFDHPTLDALADHLLAQLGGSGSAAVEQGVPAVAEPAPGLVESIEDLSDEEVERQLAERAKRKH